jgi:hypothetical protein
LRANYTNRLVFTGRHQLLVENSHVDDRFAPEPSVRKCPQQLRTLRRIFLLSMGLWLLAIPTARAQSVPGANAAERTGTAPDGQIVPVLPPAAHLDETCVVAVLNRTVQVSHDGTWVLPTIPANFGPVRARATCVRNGVALFGQSDLFTITPNQSVNLPAITLGNVSPIPAFINVTAPLASLTQGGQSTQLTAIATYPGGSTEDITAASAGTLYRSSNPAIASVSADGLVTGVGSGTAVIQASNEGAQGIFSVLVVLSVDADGDGIPDDAELRMGLDPHDPTDALLDPDHDGLTNLQEYQLGADIHNPDTDGDGLTDGQEALLYHSNPSLSDTDGDGIPDGVEIQTDSNPTNPSSFALDRALASLEVQPSSFTLAVNSVEGQASQQLTVTGHLIDGKTDIDLTSTQKGTSYSSSDLIICNFGAPDGNVFAGSPGPCTITISNSGFTATVAVQVTGFSPIPLSWLAIPGYANNVEVSGNYAYVAAGSAGLQVADVTDRSNPQLVSSLSISGNANDVKVIGNTAYIAGGSAGLQVVDVTNPLAPVLMSSFKTQGVSWDLSVVSGIAYVAADTTGLSLIDVNNPEHPFLLGSLALAGTTKGVDIDVVRKLAVAVGTEGLFAIDVSNPGAPLYLGSANYGGDPRDVAVRGSFALVADYSKSLSAVDLTDPSHPLFKSSTDLSLGGRLQDVVLSGNFALGADVFFANGVPIVDVSYAPTLSPRSILNFPPGEAGFRDDDGSGIAADATYVYLTAGSRAASTENGVTGDTRLYIGQYRALQDSSGVAPLTSIVDPVAGSTFVETTSIPVQVNASDDVAVVSVNFLVNGQVVFTATSAPYRFNVPVPVGISTLTLGATAMDFGGNIGAAADIVVNVIPDPHTTAQGTIVDPLNNPISGATVSCQGQDTTSEADGSFSIPDLSTIIGAIQCTATTPSQTAKSLEFAPARGGITQIGLIVMSLSASRGRDFWLTCPYNQTTSYDGTSVCQIFIVTEGAANYTVTADPAYNFGAAGAVTAQSPAVIKVPRLLPPGCSGLSCQPNGLMMNPDSGATVENKGIHVVADADVSVFLLNSTGSGSDMYLAIPTVSLGKDYYPILFASRSLAQETAMTASQDNTHVALVASCLSPLTPLSSPSLSPGQSYEVGCSINTGYHVNNAHVTSDQPVAVVVADPSANTGNGGSGPIAEMMLPADGPAWGTEIYSVPLPYGPTEQYQIRASQDGTTVTVDLGGGNTQTFGLNQGQLKQISFKSAARFTSNKPILVVQYSTCSAGCVGELGGVFEMQLLPISDFGKAFRFYAPADDPVAVQRGFVLWSRYAVVVAPNAAVDSIQLNGNPVNGFIGLPGGSYQYAIVPVPQGQNVVTSTLPITVYSIGFDGNYAYGTPTSF